MSPKHLVVRLIVAGAIGVGANGCDPSLRGPDLAAPSTRTGGRVALVVTDTVAPVGTRIAVSVTVDDARVGGLIGSLHFDPATLRFVGQPDPERPFTIVNDGAARRGVVRVAALDVGGLVGAGTLVFEVLAPRYAAGLTFRVEGAAAPDNAVVAIEPAVAIRVGLRARTLDTARPLTLEDWARWAGSVGGAGRGPDLVPGGSTRFGDATLDGVITIVDAFGAANQAVGNLPLITDPSKDYVIAANVAPFNLPGLGERDDPVPPGVDPDGGRVVTIFDAVAIANEAVGNDQPVVGEPIPGRQPAPNSTLVTGPIAADRTFTSDTVYRLVGLVRVNGGVRLTIEPGTRIEGDPATRGTLMIARGGMLEAAGTILEPIVMTCAQAVPVPGCWGGLVINGLSLLNNDQNGPGEVTACPEKTTIGAADLYGGCLVASASGTLSYVRIEYGGMPVSGGGATPGLALLGVGSGTVIDRVQVHGAAGHGVFVSGGTVGLRHLLVTGSGGAGVSWDDGWTAPVQFLLVQQRDNAGPGMLGSNWAGNHDALPRSEPVVFNATLIGHPGDGLPTPGVLLGAGSGLALRNAVVVGFSGPGFDVDDPATCALAVAGGAVDLSATFLFQNGQPFSGDTDCLDEGAFGTDPARGNQLVDPQLVAAYNTVTLDARPAFGSPAAGGAPAPQWSPFFDATATWYGAVEAASLTGSRIPWFTGWTRGWTGSQP